MERGRKSGVGADFVQDATKITATKSETETNAKDDVDEATQDRQSSLKFGEKFGLDGSAM